MEEQYSTCDLMSDMYNLALADVDIVPLNVLYTRPRVLYALFKMKSW